MGEAAREAALTSAQADIRAHTQQAANEARLARAA